jgi:hypothetical protein
LIALDLSPAGIVTNQRNDRHLHNNDNDNDNDNDNATRHDSLITLTAHTSVDTSRTL